MRTRSCQRQVGRAPAGPGFEPRVYGVPAGFPGAGWARSSRTGSSLALPTKLCSAACSAAGSRSAAAAAASVAGLAACGATSNRARQSDVQGSTSCRAHLRRRTQGQRGEASEDAEWN